MEDVHLVQGLHGERMSPPFSFEEVLEEFAASAGQSREWLSGRTFVIKQASRPRDREWFYRYHRSAHYRELSRKRRQDPVYRAWIRAYQRRWEAKHRVRLLARHREQYAADIVRRREANRLKNIAWRARRRQKP